MRYVLGFALFFVSAATAAERLVDLPPLHHLVNIKPSQAVQLPERFPLNHRSEIVCETCHGIEDIEDIPFDEVDKRAPAFLREGPYAKTTAFCYRCHEEKAYRRKNIHDLLDAQGKYDEKACEYCHQKALDPNKDYTREQLKLRLPPETLCLGCHLKTPHLNALNHLQKPDQKMRRRMQAAERKLGIILPLDEQGRIMCVTCHSPHERGLIDVGKPAGKQVAGGDLQQGVVYEDHPWNSVYRADKQTRLEMLQDNATPLNLYYRRLHSEVLLRLSAKDGSLCFACHEFES
ncbi:MAG: hypothetical protein L3J88_09395 [Gammaproteobacteria bacterium]|nr:hypothetical protein [Gammaproteobacteria bacterium]MCF6363537.1 hypothetical protein [Gammaproteobacteria bacterium]